MNGEEFDREFVFDQFEQFRSTEPVLYNFETTNACNMKCKMCPRTTMMTRRIETIDNEVFRRVIDQLKPFPEEDWQKWQDFVEKAYGIPREEQSENHFLRHILPKVIVLHGYGEPILDKYIAERVKTVSERKLHSYFSCNPANIDVEKILKIFENGLSYIKFAIETVDDARHKQIRGPASNFTGSYRKILQLIELKEKYGYQTVIIITMLNFSSSWEKDEFQKLKDSFKNTDVYIYLKSQDQLWYENNKQPIKAVSWLEFCHFPWTSLTVKSNGQVAMCVEDFNNEIILGDAAKETLRSIWNGWRYSAFRRMHFQLKKGIKCTDQCDMKLIGDMNLKGKLPAIRETVEKLHKSLEVKKETLYG
jgi:radical SAM protein with 4Fe4S-binding SPASM domain